MSKRVQKVCDICGSTNVTSDALAAWNVEAQEWEVRWLLDSSDCNACGSDNCVADKDADDYTKIAESMLVQQNPQDAVERITDKSPLLAAKYWHSDDCVVDKYEE